MSEPNDRAANSGGAPISKAPRPRLHPQAAEMLEATRASQRPNVHLLPVAEGRRRADADFADYPRETLAEVLDLRIPVEDGAIDARLYRPSAAVLPTVVYFHGGGWVIGSIESHDPLARALANASGCAVISAAYRLAPEHRHPTAVQDAFAATRWVHEQAGGLGLRPGPVAVAGDSAGGNLAAVVALLTRDRGGPRIALQVLVYPVTTADLELGFDDSLEGWSLCRDEMLWHQQNYFAQPADAASPLVSPLRADLRGAPPALVISAGCDPLHAQAELYVAALRQASVPVTHLAYPGQIHGFFQCPATLDDGRDAVERVAAALRDALQ
jgi:acetyl esterase/lipase